MRRNVIIPRPHPGERLRASVRGEFKLKYPLNRTEKKHPHTPGLGFSSVANNKNGVGPFF